ncbi:TIR domain-containing protein [Nostoc sp. CHAB 5834]|nr:TIR domain-containing protein [Nostoc sp. CHAB 5834]
MMAKKKVFISYDHSEDLRYRDILRAWDAHTEFEFEFDIRSPTTAINSLSAGPIKASLTKKMLEADYLFVIVGEKSHESEWMTWEIDRAKKVDTKLKLAAVKISRYYTTPLGLLNVGTSFAYSFTQAGIIEALNQATNNYIAS